jgi:ABC-type proline/glycine betaine transport system substrate-binding protein
MQLSSMCVCFMVASCHGDIDTFFKTWQNWARDVVISAYEQGDVIGA